MPNSVTRSVIEPTNPRLNVSRNANLPHSRAFGPAIISSCPGWGRQRRSLAA